IVVEARGAFLGGADAISSSNTFPSLPLIDPETLDFEMNVDGFVSSGGLGGPAILPLSLRKMSQLTQAFPHKAFSGIGGIAGFGPAPKFLAPRLGPGPGLHGSDARSRRWPQRDQAADGWNDGSNGAARLDKPRGLSRRAPRPCGCALENPKAGRRLLSRRVRN